MNDDGRDSETLSGSQAPTISGSPPSSPSSPPATIFRPSLPLGKKFGSYLLLRLLGKGGMGEVYEAEHEETGRRVALKVLSRGPADPIDRERFLREGRLAASVSHPNSVYVYGTEEIEGTAVIAMELVSGGTLKDRVEKNGPMPPREAVDTILQVVEGLEAAAARGVLHRDIKPSNCFVSGGSVKIGDYGLSISTVSRPDSHLTETGTFLGTPAFASPQQVRGDTLDLRSDIYAVGATLYYLLTGRAPFEGRGTGQVLAAVLEQTPEPPCHLRPEIPRGLERVILRCLEKQPAERFPDYPALRAQLRPFGSAAPTPATLGLRLAAGVIDHFIVNLPFILFLMRQIMVRGVTADAATAHPLLVISVQLVYFTILEGRWGASVGKRIVGLRVVGPGGGVPGLPRALLRTAVFLSYYPLLALATRAAPSTLKAALQASLVSNPMAALLLPLSFLLLFLSFLLLLFSTARRKNGFAGLHDLASRTRVIKKPLAPRRPVVSASLLAHVGAGHRRLGPYAVLETLSGEAAERLLLGYDEQLHRRVWIAMVPPGSPAISASRRDLDRAGRLRWLNGRRSAEEAWDAYEAPEGFSLSAAADRRPGWESVRFWLLDVAEELAAGMRDGTLPPALDLLNVWITADGRAKLLDFPVSDRSGAASQPVVVQDLPAMQDFLHRLCLAALKGPVPLYARSFAEDLTRRTSPDPDDLIGQLKAMLHRPARVSRQRRAYHLLLCGYLAISLGGCVFTVKGCLASRHSAAYRTGDQARPVEEARPGPTQKVPFAMALGLPALIGLVSAFLYRGGFLLRTFGIAVVARDGVKVTRLRALLRGAIAWTPWYLMTVAIFMTSLVFVLGVALAVASAFWAALVPERGLQDRIAGTWLVPR